MDSQTGQIVGERLRILRARKGISQEGLAHQIGTVRQSVSFWERGFRLPTPDTIVRLARFYGVTTDEILGLAEIRIGVAG